MIHELVGIGLVVAGLALRAWAMRHLARAGVIGDRFYGISTPPNGYTSHGPYRLVRHPAYWGTVLAVSGAGILALGWGGAVLALPVAPFLIDRALQEDRLRAAWVSRRAVERMRKLARQEPI